MVVQLAAKTVQEHWQDKWQRNLMVSNLKFGCHCQWTKDFLERYGMHSKRIRVTADCKGTRPSDNEIREGQKNQWVPDGQKWGGFARRQLTPQ
eukprot:3209771-Rhodomonas_salina.2